MLPYLWAVACGDRSLRGKLASAFISLLLAKSLGLCSPLLFKSAVDTLAGAAGSAVALQSAGQTAALARFAAGAARAIAGVAQEMRIYSFAPVAQSAARRVALSAFEHVLSLDLAWHSDRRTGSVTRTLERGTRSVGMVFRAVVFTFLPTMIELVAVCVILWNALSPSIVGLVLLTFAAYVGWTVSMTTIAAKRREEANVLDSESSGRAVDALINYETVSTMWSQQAEAKDYDKLLRSFQAASMRAEAASCTLNAGQSVSLSLGMAAVLCAVATGWGGTVGSVGDLVMANGLILQLWGPLNFLGFFWKELRSSLVDMQV